MLTPEQKDLRRTGLGGSDIAAILGLSKYATPLDIYLTKIGEKEEKETVESEFVYWGNELEELIARKYSLLKQKILSKSDQMYRHPIDSFMIANIDRNIDDENAIVECKTADFRVRNQWGEEGTNQIPRNYLLQVAHYAHVCDVDYVDIAVLIGGNDFRIYKYLRNKEAEKELVKIEENFWNNHVVARIPPLPVNVREAAHFWKSIDDKKQVASSAILSAIEELSFIKHQISNLLEKEEKIKLLICNELKDSTVLTDFQGRNLVSWKSHNVNRFDINSFKEIYPELYQEYCKKKTQRTLRILDNE